MIRMSKSIDLDHPARAVWAIMGDFHGAAFDLDQGLFANKRVVHEDDGKPARQVVFDESDAANDWFLKGSTERTAIERLDRLDDEAMVFEYSLPVPGPMPIHGYRGMLRVVSRGEAASTAEWSASCTVDPGHEENIQRFADLSMGRLFDALAERLAKSGTAAA